MKPVNKSAKKMMDFLTEGVDFDNPKKIDNKPGIFMPVSIECVGDFPYGKLYSVTHYGEQNGDLMADPDMIFWKAKTGDYFPCSFRNDYLGISRESIIFGENGPESFYAKEQADEAYFANIWMKNIKEQQELEINKKTA